MRLSDYGKIAFTDWLRTPVLGANVQAHTAEFVVIPNHIHGIIWIRESDNQRRGAATLRPYQNSNNENKINVSPKSSGAIVRSYKSAVTYQISLLRKSPGCPVWQRNYYGHIMRGQEELETIHKYILDNPDNWGNHPEYIA
jgi:putative transposase